MSYYVMLCCILSYYVILHDFVLYYVMSNSLQHSLLHATYYTTCHISYPRLAGQIGWIVSIAPDVVKSTIQTSEAPQGIIETTKQIVASRGIRGLFAGVEVGGVVWGWVEWGVICLCLRLSVCVCEGEYMHVRDRESVCLCACVRARERKRKKDTSTYICECVCVSMNVCLCCHM